VALGTANSIPRPHFAGCCHLAYLMPYVLPWPLRVYSESFTTTAETVSDNVAHSYKHILGGPKK